jgi:peptidoglycan/LPS O-acetylase OafA/YrhL
MSRGLQYQPSLDGLRAIAVGAVVLFHTWPALFPGGWAGVDLFFVLSGYLITQILVRELEATGAISLKRFYIRRALRLMPALAVLILAFLAFSAVAENDLRRAGLDALIAATYLTNWARAFGWGASAIGHTWSLAIEEQFYLVWPLLLIFLMRLSRPRLIVSLLLLAAIGWRLTLYAGGASVPRIYNGFDTHADPLLIGCLLALAPRALAGRFAALALLLLAALVLLMDFKSAFAQTFGFALVGATGAWLIAAASAEGWLKSALSWAPLVFLGKISYGIYLWHFPIIDIGRGHVPEALLFVLPLLGLACAVGSYYVVERPFLRLKDRWAAKGSRPAPAPRPAGEPAPQLPGAASR